MIEAEVTTHIKHTRRPTLQPPSPGMCWTDCVEWIPGQEPEVFLPSTYAE